MNELRVQFVVNFSNQKEVDVSVQKKNGFSPIEYVLVSTKKSKASKWKMVECQNGITILSRSNMYFFILKIVMNMFISITESLKLFQLQDKTPSEDTGPERAKGGKYYMYIETSTMKSGENARLISSLLTTGSL